MPAREDKIKGVHGDPGEAQQWDGAASKRLMEIQHVDAFPKHARDSYTPKVHKTVGLPQAKKRKTDKTGGYQAIGQGVDARYQGVLTARWGTAEPTPKYPKTEY